MMKYMFDEEEIDSLIAILHTKGISYLLGNGSSLGKDHGPADPVNLLQRLAVCGYPLVEHAMISLFLLHPEFAPAAIEALQQSEPAIAEQITVCVLAALYLQNWWFFRLSFAFGRLPSFPQAPFAYLWEERHLPSPDARYGMDGLLALQEYEQQQYGVPLNFLGDWQNQIQHLLAQEEAYRRTLPDEQLKILAQMSIYDAKDEIA